MRLFNHLKTFSKGGIHPDPSKITAGMPITPLPSPRMVKVLLSQHIGAPAKCIVKPKQQVAAGEKIGEAQGFVSAPVHSPIAGTVKKIELVRDGQGLWKEAVVIEASEENPSFSLDFDESTPLRSDEEIKALSPSDITAIVGEAGIVGLGGASFPTRVKLTLPEGKSADTFIINGAECEPFLTCDDALMRAFAPRILEGVALLMRAAGTPRAVVGIEANKPEAIAAMKKAASVYGGSITVEALRTAYPQGSEKQLIYALTRRTVPAGGLPVDAHVIVDNVATAFAVYRAVRFGEPLTRRVATVTGPAMQAPGNYIVCTGMDAASLIEQAGGLPDNTGKIIAGGPMMGRAMCRPDSPLTKSSGGLLVLPADMARRGPTDPCMRCATCISACPMGLEPYLLQTLGEFSRPEDAREAGVLNCLECGSCSYVCPSRRPILDYIRLAKQQVRALPKE